MHEDVLPNGAFAHVLQCMHGSEEARGEES